MKTQLGIGIASRRMVPLGGQGRHTLGLELCFAGVVGPPNV